jgi:hypothetical protein
MLATSALSPVDHETSGLSPVPGRAANPVLNESPAAAIELGGPATGGATRSGTPARTPGDAVSASTATATTAIAATRENVNLRTRAR